MPYIVNINARFLYLICQCSRFLFNLIHYYPFNGPPGEDIKEQLLELLGFVRDNLEYVSFPPKGVRRYMVNERTEFT